MEDWLNLINAETEGDLMDIQNSTEIPEVKKAIVMLRELNADEKIRQEAFYREKRIHDEATALNGARREGIEIGRAEGKAEGKAEGIAEGMAKGKAEGIAEGINEMIVKMRKMGMSEEQINKIINVE